MIAGAISSFVRPLNFMRHHPLTRDRLMYALGRFVKWQIESRIKSDVEFEWIMGAKLLVRKGMTGATGNIYCGLHEFADMGFLLHLLRPGDLFIDVGANVGTYTVLASAVVGAETVAFEPDPQTMSYLRRNVTLNQISERVTAVEAAAGRETGTAQFTIGFDTTNHIVTGKSDNVREVDVVRLDDVLEQHSPAMIKMDVEGFEAAVLYGARNTLRKPSLLAVETEGSCSEVIRMLTSAGFMRTHYDPFTRSLSRRSSNAETNALFVRHSAAVADRLRGAPTRDVFGKCI